MIKKCFHLLILPGFLFCGSVCFSETQIGLNAFTVEPNSEIEVTSNSMVFNNETKFTEFLDNVVIKYGKLTVKAKAMKISQVSLSSPEESLEFRVEGPLEISNGTSFIYGNNAFYSRKNQEITVSGNVNLLQGSNKIFGDTLVLNLNNGLAKISGSVRTILVPTGKNQNE